MMFFISGLPRSGSTLLASLLNQNPSYHTSIISPTGAMVERLLAGMNDSETRLFISEEQRHDILRGVFFDYYKEQRIKHQVVFDNNRNWCKRVSLLLQLFPSTHFIVMVRPCHDIVESLERVFREHPAYLSSIYGRDNCATVFERVNAMLGPDGVVGFAWDAVQDAFFGPHRDRLIIIEYDQFVRNPKEILRQIELHLGLEPFKYDPEHIQQIPGAAEFDRWLAAPGLHELRPKVSFDDTLRMTVPPKLAATFAVPFWRGLAPGKTLKESSTPAQ